MFNGVPSAAGLMLRLPPEPEQPIPETRFMEIPLTAGTLKSYPACWFGSLSGQTEIIPNGHAAPGAIWPWSPEVPRNMLTYRALPALMSAKEIAASAMKRIVFFIKCGLYGGKFRKIFLFL